MLNCYVLGWPSIQNRMVYCLWRPLRWSPPMLRWHSIMFFLVSEGFFLMKLTNDLKSYLIVLLKFSTTSIVLFFFFRDPQESVQQRSDQRLDQCRLSVQSKCSLNKCWGEETVLQECLNVCMHFAFFKKSSRISAEKSCSFVLSQTKPPEL